MTQMCQRSKISNMNHWKCKLNYPDTADRIRFKGIEKLRNHHNRNPYLLLNNIPRFNYLYHDGFYDDNNFQGFDLMLKHSLMMTNSVAQRE